MLIILLQMLQMEITGISEEMDGMDVDDERYIDHVL